ncbi:MAG: hypothetical protein H7174_12930 [Flavobacterium sp.]|nr:hypothetical protein [Flavobacterium sp.]
MPITAAQLSSSPSSIPLWHFDENLGIWLKEGTATKVGSTYQGSV